MKIVILGPPGSGKGTYASRISERLGIPHISTGDLLREEIRNQTETGKRIESIMNKGDLVPDEVVISILKNRISKDDCSNGFILDGFPRTIEQAKKLEEITSIDVVIFLDVPDWVIIKRLTSRRVCEKCGAIYNLLTNPPKQEELCDKCRGRLVQREDDKEEVIRERLKIYKEKTELIIRYYKDKGLLKTVEWKKEDIPEEEQDMPLSLMLEKIMSLLNA